MLSVQGLTCGYGGTPVVGDISFSLEEGEFLAILGPNGTGKTTLLRALGMLRPPQSGRCLLAGEDLSRLSPRERARRVAYLPQNTQAPFPMTAMDVVLLGRAPYSRFSPNQEDREAAAAVLDRLGLGGLALRDVSRLSGGERQQVLLARALAQKPQLLLLDEPTSSLDLKNQLHTMALVRELCRKEGLTAVAAIHDLNLAAMFCSPLLMLLKGQIFAQGTPREVLTPENILAIYGVRARILSGTEGIRVLPLETGPWD